MKNAFVLVAHHGDDGTVGEGDILRDVTELRFAALEKGGLVREATDKEAKGSGPAAEKAKQPAANKAAPTPENKAS